MAASSPPAGTIAFLFSDIEGSTRLADMLGGGWRDVLHAHHALLRAAIEEAGGFIASSEGDAFFATFVDAAAAARAAVAAQRALRHHAWPAEVGELKVRMGLHVGFAEWSSTGYVGLEVHRGARVAAAAHGGQLLMTAQAVALAGGAVATEPLGLHRMKDFPVPEPLYCALLDGRGAAAFPPPRTEQVRPTNLPAGLPALIGREADLDRLRAALLHDGERIVTLTGRGGAGKTSLALVGAVGLLDEYPGGVWLVPLASLTDAGEVLPAISSVLGAESEIEGDAAAALVTRLRGAGRALIILDNFEHLSTAAADVEALLARLPEVAFLVTSQAPLRLAGERGLPVDTLDHRAALTLLERSAAQRSVRPTPGAEQHEALRAIVAMLDGLPLALELAAARLTVLTPVQLRDRLARSLGLLRDDRHGRPDRHRSLAATVQWTMAALPAAARELFVRLGAFAGPAELEEIEAICGGDGLDVLDSLSALLEVALVRRVESGDLRIRFGLPEALHQMASAMLDEAPGGPQRREAHLRRQHELAWAARHGIGPAAPYRAALAADLEAGAALRWAQATGHPLAVPLAAARAALLADTGRLREANALVEPLLASGHGEREVLGQAHLANASIQSALGRLERAFASADAAVELIQEPHGRVAAFVARGIQHGRAGRFEAAVDDLERAIELAREVGPAELASALYVASQAHMESGQVALGTELLHEAERIAEAADARGPWPSHTLRGDLAVLSSRPDEAVEHYARAVELAHQDGQHVQVYWDLVSLADALAMGHRDREALEVAGIAEAQIRELGATRAVGWHVQGVDRTREAAERLGPRAAEQLRARGRKVKPNLRVARACSLARALQPVGE